METGTQAVLPGTTCPPRTAYPSGAGALLVAEATRRALPTGRVGVPPGSGAGMLAGVLPGTTYPLSIIDRKSVV